MYTFPLREFCSKFREFSDATKYSQSTIQNAADRALLHVTPDIEGMPMRGPYRNYAVFLMTAHILVLDEANSESANDGTGLGGMAYKATVGSVTVESTKPNSFTQDSFDFWLSQTRYGRELLSFLELQAPAGIYLSGDSARDLI